VRKPSATDLLGPLGIRPEHKVVLFLGRIHPIKGADRLLEAFMRVHASFPDALLVLAGPDEFGLESSLRERSEVLLRTKRIIFPGMVSGALKAELLARADLFCLPSDAEGFSMAALEAMAAETAVLLSPGCHFPEVESSGAGVISDSAPEALTAALARLLADPDTLKSMGRAGAHLVAERYSVDRTAELTLEAYEEGIQRFRSRNSRLIPTPGS
jgi:glycosyltransferase involved in cell wall biosynthesis